MEIVICPRQDFLQGRGAAARAAGFGMTAVLFTFRFHGLVRLEVLGAAVALALGFFSVALRSRRGTKLRLTDGQLVFTGARRERVVLAADAPGRIVQLEVYWGASSGRRSRLWLLLNGSGVAQLGLNRDVWDPADLERLRERLGLRVETIIEPRSAREVRTAYPGSIPWPAVHPMPITLLGITLLTGLVLAVR